MSDDIGSHTFKVPDGFEGFQITRGHVAVDVTHPTTSVNTQEAVDVLRENGFEEVIPEPAPKSKKAEES